LSFLVSSALVDRLVVHELLIFLSILLTSPVSAMSLMLAAMFRRRDAGTG
jgi:multicomponent K+:H+ antiporter subunit G